MTTPQRIQLRRTAGWRLQDASRDLNGLPARSVARPGPFGNPFRITEDRDARECVIAFRTWLTVDGCTARIPGKKAAILDALPRLKGKNLACFCPLDAPCHADVLLELANDLDEVTNDRRSP